MEPEETLVKRPMNLPRIAKSFGLRDSRLKNLKALELGENCSGVAEVKSVVGMK